MLRQVVNARVLAQDSHIYAGALSPSRAPVEASHWIYGQGYWNRIDWFLPLHQASRKTCRRSSITMRTSERQLEGDNTLPVLLGYTHSADALIG